MWRYELWLSESSPLDRCPYYWKTPTYSLITHTRTAYVRFYMLQPGFVVNLLSESILLTGYGLLLPVSIFDWIFLTLAAVPSSILRYLSTFQKWVPFANTSSHGNYLLFRSTKKLNPSIDLRRFANHVIPIIDRHTCNFYISSIFVLFWVEN